MTDVSINTIRLSGILNDEVSVTTVGQSEVAETDLSFVLPKHDGGTRKAFIQIQMWGDTAELVRLGESGVGAEVIVEGTLDRRAWKTKDDEWASKYSIRVEKISELGAEPSEPLPF